MLVKGWEGIRVMGSSLEASSLSTPPEGTGNNHIVCTLVFSKFRAFQFCRSTWGADVMCVTFGVIVSNSQVELRQDDID